MTKEQKFTFLHSSKKAGAQINNHLTMHVCNGGYRGIKNADLLSCVLLKGTTLSIVLAIVLSYQSGRMCSCSLRSCGGHGSGTAVSSPYAAEPAPEERAQRIAKAVRKQSIEVKENWEQLKIRASNWQKQVEKALEKLQELQKVLDDLEAHVITAEGVHTDRQPVSDLLIDSLQDHLDKTTGKDYLQNLRLGFERQQPLFWRDNGNCRCWRMRDNNVWSWMKTAGQAAS
ncbi:uncharacterized protein LOC132209152 isoform X3 [Stegostoma tigrinum]|uniref:uncharacterized protein LOC132209152 isoform X3 n=1 Tax=Stegostoma tigrinum TaxID=3053191 RepID=UPI002870A816|nr:uncharacterized protein LOC132209152 isoform X3 [Stegostoma tigrinum]